MTINEIDQLFINLSDKNDKIRFPSFKKLCEITEKKVKWIYDKWFLLVEKTNSNNSFQRSIGLTLLANLAKSDYENRLEKIIDEYLNHFEDEKFITARQCIQNAWKIAIANKRLTGKIISHLEQSYSENIHHKTHANLIKQDIIDSLIKINKLTGDKKAATAVQSLIEDESDIKLKKVLQKILAGQN